ncbi:MAG: ABC transporter permease [Xenococcaceae cyanobacterium MO_207.B15]|nr:ABC transporter permease [Xenococcaceae cyanobacterium MO_207.B15]MDJ0744085.1 ABC transporter permease [Xenococcaceae cyanobacterium MO_167.B27]
MTVQLKPKKKPTIKKASGMKPTIFWRIAEDIPQALSWTMMGFSIIIPLCCWFIFANYSGIDATFLPSPSSVGNALIKLWEKGFLTQDIAASFTRVTIGFLLSILVAIPLGIIMGSFASIRALFEPIIGIVRYMPAPAFIPLLIIYLGIDEAPKIALIFIGTVFFNILMIMDAVKFIPKDLIETTYTLGGSRWQVLVQVITPYIVPSIIDTFRINMAASWNLVVVSELLAASEGLGRRILLAQKFLKTDEIFACLIVLGLIGFALDLSFRLLLRFTCKWAFD